MVGVHGHAVDGRGLGWRGCMGKPTASLMERERVKGIDKGIEGSRMVGGGSDYERMGMGA